MRLLFVAADMHRGGAERHWATLIPALADRGAEVRLLCLNDEGPLFQDVGAAGVPARCLHLAGRTDLPRLAGALAEAKARPGAVVTRGVSPQLTGEAIARAAGAAHVLNEHTPLTPEGELLALRPHQARLTRAVAPLVDRVIAVSERQVAPLERRGYRAERIVTIPNGVFERDVATARPAAETRHALGLGLDDFAVLCVANLRPEKGVGTFVEAIARARATVPRVRGLVAGDGPQRAELERLVAGRDGIELLGSRGDVPDLVAACDARTRLVYLSHVSFRTGQRADLKKVAAGDGLTIASLAQRQGEHREAPKAGKGRVPRWDGCTRPDGSVVVYLNRFSRRDATE